MIRSEPPPAEPPPPQPLPPESPPTPLPPPAKRTKKAAKRPCEVELLRGAGMDDVQRLSPPPHAPPLPTWSPSPPSLTPASSPTPALDLPLTVSPRRPPTPTFCTPNHSYLAPALSPVFSPPAPFEPSSPPQMAVEVKNATTSPALSPIFSPPTLPDPPASPQIAAQEEEASSTPPPTSPKPPAAPPWPEAYVFSTDPDRIICRKCCKRHYNYKWYSHCFMCHMDEKET
jgi:hypothetical protein